MLHGLVLKKTLWVQYWFKKIVIEIIKHPESRFESIPKIIQQAFCDLDNGRLSNPELELRFSQRLKYYPHEYKLHVRTGILAREL